MCGGGPDNHHAITVAADLPPPPPSVVAVEMAPPRGHRPGKEVEYNEEEEDDDDEYDGREFEEEFLRFSMMVDEEDDDGDDDDEVEVEIIAVVSPPHRPLVGARGTTSAVESVTNLQARTSPLPNPVVPQTGTKASKRGDSGAKAKPAAAKKRRSKHGFLGVHQRTYGRWSAEIRDNVIKGSRFWIGTFDTALDAALAYDAVSRRLYGLNAKTNFPAAAGEDDLPPPPAAGEALQLHQAAKEMQHQWRSWRRRGAAASRGYSGGGSSWRGADKPTVQRGGAGAGEFDCWRPSLFFTQAMAVWPFTLCIEKIAFF
ncbi:hypothetical protein OsJ_36776 [Oryza sativa Japonica Group]|uniref:AP2/ERF domain-containing protein n=1 Tax=Oryza sativa subsp. japonica TaxID=39947 RepID=B9GE49_ORYSJ|nr:hypothetical protein OsJ_36776 [Oryza sativa Japonica Group]